jgi:superfamily I DNA/RNA helicase
MENIQVLQRLMQASSQQGAIPEEDGLSLMYTQEPNPAEASGQSGAGLSALYKFLEQAQLLREATEVGSTCSFCITAESLQSPIGTWELERYDVFVNLSRALFVQPCLSQALLGKENSIGCGYRPKRSSKSRQCTPSMRCRCVLSSTVPLLHLCLQNAAEGETVSLMTMHAAKGLEFRAVFIAGGFSWAGSMK